MLCYTRGEMSLNQCHQELISPNFFCQAKKLPEHSVQFHLCSKFQAQIGALLAKFFCCLPITVSQKILLILFSRKKPSTLNLLMKSTLGINFTNVLRSAFMCPDPAQKHKNSVKLSVSFFVFGILKAACKIDPWGWSLGEFTQILRFIITNINFAS